VLIISDALFTHADEQGEQYYSLHPSLSLVRYAYHQQWFDCTPRLPVEVIAWLQDCSPVSCASPQSMAVGQAQQCWLAAPYHAQLRRDRFYVLPAAELEWCAEDAQRLCNLLNPVLADDHMTLLACGTQLLMLMQEPLSADPASFATIDGHVLPNRPPEGDDGLRLMRLVGDVQTQLYQTPLLRADLAPMIHGLWFWAGESLPCPPIPASKFTLTQSLADAADATVVTAEQCQQLQHWPDQVLCLGEGTAVWLKRKAAWSSWWSQRAKKGYQPSWQANGKRDESALRQQLLELLNKAS